MDSLTPLSKLKGSTILEVVVAMVLLMIVVSVSAMVWIKIMYAHNTPQRAQAAIWGSEILSKTVNSYPNDPRLSETDNWRIEKNILPTDRTNISQVTVVVYQKDGRKLWEGRQLMWVP